MSRTGTIDVRQFIYLEIPVSDHYSYRASDGPPLAATRDQFRLVAFDRHTFSPAIPLHPEFKIPVNVTC